MLPNIRTFAEEVPTLAYLGGTNTFDHVRIIGRINEDGLCEDITVHIDGFLAGTLMPGI